MIKNLTALTITLVCLLFTFFVSANEKSPEGIEVVGYAVVEIKPDIYTVNIKVKERNISATKSQQLVEYKMQLVKNAAKSFVKQHDDIRLSTLQAKAIELDSSITVNGVISRQTFANGGQGGVFISTDNLNQNSNASTNIPQIVMEASQDITVKLSSISHYNQFMDSIIKVGVSHISPVKRSFSQQDKFYQQALDQALVNANQKAKKLADVMQVKLGRLLFIKENKLPTTHLLKSSDENDETADQQIKAEIIARFAIEN